MVTSPELNPPMLCVENEMNIFVKSTSTGKYLTPTGNWSENPLVALNFPSSTDAFFYCANKSLKNVELVANFNQRLQTTIPIYRARAEQHLPLDD